MINKNMTIQSIIEVNEDIVPILMASGMHCIGCAMASGETLEEACMVHGIDVDELEQRINDFLAK